MPVPCSAPRAPLGALRTLVVLLLPLALAACSTVGGGGSLASVDGLDEPLSDEPVVVYDRAPEIVWANVKQTLVHLSARQPRFEEDTLRAFATLTDGSVQVEVRALEDGLTEMIVKGRRYGVKNAELSASVLATIDEQIDR